MAKGLPQIDGWCGDHAVYFRREGKIGSDLINLDVLTGKEMKLQFGLSTVLLGCSPNGRWVLTESSIGKPRSGNTEGSEGGNPSCDVFLDRDLDRVLLWDMQDATHRAVGKGYIDFEWSPDGRLLLFNFRPHCNLESNPGNFFRLPASIKEFRAVSVAQLIATLIGPNTGWSDKKRIGALNWYSPDAFVAQLPEDDGMWLTNDTPGGAIVTVQQPGLNIPSIEQVNPSGFQPTLKLAIPQIPASASDEILKAAHCAVSTDLKKRTSMSCLTLDQFGTASFHLDLAKYCRTLSAGDVNQFCAPVPPKSTWWRMARGFTVLLVKPNSLGRAGTDLFRIENDSEGYLK